MASPRWFVAYALVGGRWQPAGQGWEGQGGENVAPLAALQGNQVFLYSWNPDTQSWTSGMFDAMAAAAARPKVQVSIIAPSGMAIDTAAFDSLLWNTQKDALNQFASRYNFSLDPQLYTQASYAASRNVYTPSDAQGWIQFNASIRGV